MFGDGASSSVVHLLDHRPRLVAIARRLSEQLLLTQGVHGVRDATSTLATTVDATSSGRIDRDPVALIPTTATAATSVDVHNKMNPCVGHYAAAEVIDLDIEHGTVPAGVNQHSTENIASDG